MSLNISDHLLKDNRFVLEVKGDSMQGDDICDGDYIICEPRSNINKDDIAVVLIDSVETTLKRIQYNQDRTVTLFASNPSYSPPMLYNNERVTIQGVYIGLLRLNVPEAKTKQAGRQSPLAIVSYYGPNDHCILLSDG